MIKASLLVAGILLSPMAFAQDCSSAVEVFSNNTNGTFAAPGATTCGAANPFVEFPGGIGSPQPDVLYKFTANDANAVITLDTTGSPLIPGILVLDACSDSSANIVASKTGNAGQAIQMNVSGLTNGHEYFMVVTSKPGSPDDNCGAFGGSISGTLPVSLQEFSID